MACRERLDAVRRWYEQDGRALEPKLRTSIIEGHWSRAGPGGAEARRVPRDTANDGGEGMNERDDTNVGEQAPIRVATREEFDTAVVELFRSGRPIEAPSLEVLADWDVDLEDDEGGMEGP